MLKKYLFYISVLFIICHIPVFSQEQGPPDKPLPNLIISNDDYLTTRNNSQGDSQNNVNSYNGYYKPSSVNEPFNFKKTDDKLKAFPENNSNQEGYSGYYNNPPMEGYKFPEPSVAPESNQNNALELTDSDLLKGLDIKSKGIPIWKQTNRVNVEVNKIVERNVRVFQLTQQNNDKVLEYNIEFPSNKQGDKTEELSFILKIYKSEVYILQNQEKGQQKEEKIGNFLTEENRGSGYKKIMTFSYNDKEIKLIILMEEAGKTIPPQENQKLENNVQTPSQNKHIPVINENNMENKNTLLEINL